MSEKKLLPGESVVMEWGRLTLTSHRVFRDVIEQGHEVFTSLALDQVQWVRMHRTQRPILLYVAALIAALGVAAMAILDAGLLMGLCFGIALVCVWVYFATRRGLVTIAAGEGRIEVVLAGVDRELADSARGLLAAVQERSLRARGRL